MSNKPEQWYVRDWYSDKDVFNGKRFNSFEDARAYIDEIASAEAYEKYPLDKDAQEVHITGVCEDLYAERVKE